MRRAKRRGWLGTSPVNEGRKRTPIRGTVLLENGRDVLEYEQGPFGDTNAPIEEFSDIRIMSSEVSSFRQSIRDKSYAARPDSRDKERDMEYDNDIERHTEYQRFDRGRKRVRSPDRGKYAKRVRSTRDRGSTERDRESDTWYLRDFEQRRTQERDIIENEPGRNRDWINHERSESVRMRSESPDNRYYMNDSDRYPIQEREFAQRELPKYDDGNSHDRSPYRERQFSRSPVRILRHDDNEAFDSSIWSPESSPQGRGYSDDSPEEDWHNGRIPRGYDENDRNRINEKVSHHHGQWNDEDRNVYINTGKFRLQDEPFLEDGEWPQSPGRLGQDQIRYPDVDQNLFSNRSTGANLIRRSIRQDGFNSYSAAPLNWTTQGGGRLEPEQQRNEHLNDRRKSLESITFDSTKSLEEQLQSKDFKDDVIAEILGIVSEKRYSTGDLTTAGLLTLLRNTTKINFLTLEHLTSFLTEQDFFFDLTKSSSGSFVIPKTGIHVCQEYVSRNKSSCSPTCSALHICKFYLFGTCNKQETCTLGHDLFSDHNMPVLKHARLHRCNRKDIKLLISEADNRNLTTLPIICKFYNNQTKCKKPQTCPHLHICKRFVMNDCKFGPIKCFRDHDLNKPQCDMVLDRFGLNSISEHKLICLLKKTLSNKSTNTLRYYSSVTSGSSDRKQSTAVPSQAEKIRLEMKLVEEKIKKKKMLAKENDTKDTVNVKSENNNIVPLTCPTLLTVNSPASLSRKKSPSPLSSPASLSGKKSPSPTLLTVKSPASLSRKKSPSPPSSPASLSGKKSSSPTLLTVKSPASLSRKKSPSPPNSPASLSRKKSPSPPNSPASLSRKKSPSPTLLTVNSPASLSRKKSPSPLRSPASLSGKKSPSPTLLTVKSPASLSRKKSPSPPSSPASLSRKKSPSTTLLSVNSSASLSGKKSPSPPSSPASLSRKKSPSPPSYTTSRQSAQVLSRLECTSESESYSRTPSPRYPRYRSNSPNSPKYSPISPVYTETSSQHQTECQLSPGHVLAYQDNEPLSLTIIKETSNSGSATSDDTPTSERMALGASTHQSGSPNSHQAIERTPTDTSSISEKLCGQLEDGRVNNGHVNNSTNNGDTNVCPSETEEAMELDVVTEQYLPETVESPERDTDLCDEPENEGNMQTKQSIISDTDTEQFPSKADDLSIQKEIIIGESEGVLQNDKTADVIDSERTALVDDHQEGDVPNASSIMEKVQDDIRNKEEMFGTLSLDSLENDVTLHSNLPELQDRNKDEIVFSTARDDRLDNGIKEVGINTETALIDVDTGTGSFQNYSKEECIKPEKVNKNLENIFKEEDSIDSAKPEKTNSDTDPKSNKPLDPVCIINTISSHITKKAAKPIDNISEIDQENDMTLHPTTPDIKKCKIEEESVSSGDFNSDLTKQVSLAFFKDVRSISNEVNRHAIESTPYRKVSIHHEGTDIIFTYQDNQWHVPAEGGLSQPVHDKFADVIADAFSRLLETSKSILSHSASNDSAPLTTD